MQTVKLPRTICDDLDKRVRRFIWGGSEDTQKIHLIPWETLQRPKSQGGVGVRSARQANSAFLTKLGWIMLTEPNAFWSRVLRAKYCKGRCDIDMFEPKVGMSNTWRGVIDNAKDLCKRMRVAVGNGAKTLLWDHKWAANMLLGNLAIQEIPVEIAGVTVQEMWEERVGWKREIFAPYLQPDILKLIQAHELKNNEYIGDLVYWHKAPKGKFSIKTKLQIIRNESNEFNDIVWDLIWSAPIQQRIRAFIWLACHDRILGNENRYKRHLTDDPKCYICGDAEESTLHILRNCLLLNAYGVR